MSTSGFDHVARVRECGFGRFGTSRPDEIRIRVTAAGLNPLDWQIAATPDLATAFGVAVPCGFGCDFAGVVDEIGSEASGFAVGDRVYGGAMAKAVADFVTIKTPTPPTDVLLHTPPRITDEVAAALPIAGLTTIAALDAIGVGHGDTILIGGAAGGVGVLAVQLAKLAGATVIGTASPGTFDFLRQLGSEPTAYGAGLIDRVRALAGDEITAATDLYGTEAAEVALALGVPPQRISTVAAGSNPPEGVIATGAHAVDPAALDRITDAIASGDITVPIAAAFPIEEIRDAVMLQSGRHVHGKVIVTM